MQSKTVAWCSAGDPVASCLSICLSRHLFQSIVFSWFSSFPHTVPPRPSCSRFAASLCPQDWSSQALLSVFLSLQQPHHDNRRDAYRLLPIQDQAIIVRLRTDLCKLTHHMCAGFHIGHSVLCPCCTSPMTVEHLLQDRLVGF